MWTDPSHIEKMRLSTKKHAAQRWANPEYRYTTVLAIQKGCRNLARRKAISEAKKRYWANPINRQRQGARAAKQWDNPVFKKRMATESARRWANPEYRKRLSIADSNGAKKRFTDPVQRAAIKALAQRLWSNPEYKEKRLRELLKASSKTPTKPELKLNEVLEGLFPGEFKYNGSRGDVILAGYMPDFINVNGKKQIIELYGCYWHGCKECGHNDAKIRAYDKKRLAKIRNLGWKSFVVWEHDLNGTQLKDHLVGFVRS